MPEPTSTGGIVAALGSVAIAVPGVGASAVFLRKLWTRTIRNEERIENLSQTLRQEQKLRRESDSQLSVTIKDVSNSTVVSVRELNIRLDASTQATHAQNVLSAEIKSELNGLTSRLDRADRRHEL